MQHNLQKWWKMKNTIFARHVLILKYPDWNSRAGKREACLHHGLTGGQRRCDTGGKSLLLSSLNTENLCCAFIVPSLPSLRLLSQHEELEQAREHGLVCPFIKHFSGKKQTSRAKRAFLYHTALRKHDWDLIYYFFLDDKMIRYSYTAVLHLITLIASLSSVSRY